MPTPVSEQPPPLDVIAGEAVYPPGSSYQCCMPYWIISLTLAGRTEQGRPGGDRFHNQAREVLFLRIHTPQLWRVIDGDDWHVLYCVFQPRPHWLPWLNLAIGTQGFGQLYLDDDDDLAGMEAALRRVMALHCLGDDHSLDRAYHAVEEAILICNRHAQGRDRRRDPIVDSAVAHIMSRLDRPLLLDSLARHCRCSRSRLAAGFKQAMGISPMAFWNQQRLIRARQLLLGSWLSIKQIAAELGFPNPKYFSTSFRKHYGSPPSEYRQRHAM